MSAVVDTSILAQRPHSFYFKIFVINYFVINNDFIDNDIDG